MSKPTFIGLPWEDVIIENILPELSILDCLNLRYVSKSCMDVVDMYLEGLKVLFVPPRTISRHAFSVLSEKCRSLTTINLNRCEITDLEVVPLFLNNKKISSVQMKLTPKVTAKCLQPLIVHCPNLKVLKIGKCTWITMGALEALALHHSNLEEVDLSYCVTVSEDCIMLFLKKFNKLSKLSLKGNKQVTDKCLSIISRYNTSLKSLNVAGCPEVTDKGIKSLVALEKLEKLYIETCKKITEDSIKLLQPKTKIESVTLDRWTEFLFTARGWMTSSSGRFITYNRRKQRYIPCEPVSLAQILIKPQLIKNVQELDIEDKDILFHRCLKEEYLHTDRPPILHNEETYCIDDLH